MEETQPLETIDRNDVYHVLRALLDELPLGAAALKRHSESGRCQLIPSRQSAARLYAIGNISDCEVGIVKVTHSHFDNESDALQFCRKVVYEGIAYDVWMYGDSIVRAQSCSDSAEESGIAGGTEVVPAKPLAELRKERLSFEPYI